MEPQNNNQPLQEIEKSSLNEVTPLSKYLAMALFVILPFLGGYLGYTYAPEKVVEDDSSVISEIGKIEVINPMVETNTQPTTKVTYGQFIAVPPNQYSIPTDYFPEYNNLYSYQARKISDNLLLVLVASPSQPARPIGTVLFDEVSNSVVRPVTFTLNTIDVWVNSHTRVVLEWGTGKQRLVVYDYISDVNQVLYEESESDVQLADVCEMGCGGVLYVTTDGTLVFGRHRSIAGTTSAQLLEIKTIPIPREYLKRE